MHLASVAVAASFTSLVGHASCFCAVAAEHFPSSPGQHSKSGALLEASNAALSYQCYVAVAFCCRSRSPGRDRRDRSDRRDSRYRSRSRSRSRSRERGDGRLPRPGAAGAAAAARGAAGSSGGYPGPPPAAAEQAPLQQTRLPEEPVLGAVYRGKVSGIMEFGCFVEVQGFGHLGKKVGTCCPFLLQTCRNSRVNAYGGCAVRAQSACSSSF